MTVAVEVRARRAPRRARRRGTPIVGLLPLALALGLWQLFGSETSPYFPVPSTWYGAVKPLASDGELWRALGATCLTFVIALVVATVVGAVLGTLIGSSRRTDRAMAPSLEFLRTLPASAVVPIATLVLGYTGTAKLAVVILPATWPILLNVRAARRSMNALVAEVALTLGLSRRERIAKILIPTLAPSVLLGVRLAAPLALIITLLFEIITKIDGLGALLSVAQANFLSAKVYGLLVVAGALAVAVNWIVVRAEATVMSRMRGHNAR